MARRALLAFPEGAGLAAVEELRQRFDPLAQVVPAHVTLVFPYVDDLSATALQRHVRGAIEDQRAFDATFDGVGQTEGEFLLLRVGRGRTELIGLHDRLYRGPLAIHLARGHAYDPHVTLGRVPDESARASALALARVPPFDARVSAVAVFRLEGPTTGSVEFTVPLPS